MSDSKHKKVAGKKAKASALAQRKGRIVRAQPELHPEGYDRFAKVLGSILRPKK